MRLFYRASLNNHRDDRRKVAAKPATVWVRDDADAVARRREQTVKKFLFLYKGFEQPTPEIGAAWMKWFGEVGDAMVDPGNPLSAGIEVTREGATALDFGLDALTGYSVIAAEDIDAALALAKTNPMITSVVVYELGHM